MHWRKMTWAILGWTGLFAFWAIGGSARLSDKCAGMVGDALSACQAGTAIGGGLGLAFIFVLWFAGFVVLSLVWLMRRSR